MIVATHANKEKTFVEESCVIMLYISVKFSVNVLRIIGNGFLGMLAIF